MAIWQTATPEKLAAELDSIEMTSNEDIEQRRDRIQKQLSELRNELNTSAEASRLAKLETEITQQTEALKQAVADHQEREKALITSASRVDVPPGGKKAYIGTRRGSLNVRILNSDGDTVNTTPDGARWKLPKNTEVIDLGERKPGDANSRYKGEWAKISFKEPGKDTPIHAWVAADYLVDHPSKAASRKEAVRSTPSAAAAKEAEKKAEVAVKTAQDKVTKLEGDLAAMKEEDDPDAYQAKKDEVEAAKAQLMKAQEKKEKLKAAVAPVTEKGATLEQLGVKLDMSQEELEEFAYPLSEARDVLAQIQNFVKDPKVEIKSGPTYRQLELSVTDKNDHRLLIHLPNERDGSHSYSLSATDSDGNELPLNGFHEDDYSLKTQVISAIKRFNSPAGIASVKQLTETLAGGETFAHKTFQRLALRVLEKTPEVRFITEGEWFNLVFQVGGRTFKAFGDSNAIVNIPPNNRTYDKGLIYVQEVALKGDTKFADIQGTSSLVPSPRGLDRVLQWNDSQGGVDENTDTDDKVSFFNIVDTFEETYLKPDFSRMKADKVPPLDANKTEDAEKITKLTAFQQTVVSTLLTHPTKSYVQKVELSQTAEGVPSVSFVSGGKNINIKADGASRTYVVTELDKNGTVIKTGIHGSFPMLNAGGNNRDDVVDAIQKITYHLYKTGGGLGTVDVGHLDLLMGKDTAGGFYSDVWNNYLSDAIGGAEKEEANVMHASALDAQGEPLSEGVTWYIYGFRFKGKEYKFIRKGATGTMWLTEADKDMYGDKPGGKDGIEVTDASGDPVADVAVKVATYIGAEAAPTAPAAKAWPKDSTTLNPEKFTEPDKQSTGYKALFDLVSASTFIPGKGAVLATDGDWISYGFEYQGHAYKLVAEKTKNEVRVARLKDNKSKGDFSDFGDWTNEFKVVADQAALQTELTRLDALWPLTIEDKTANAIRAAAKAKFSGALSYTEVVEVRYDNGTNSTDIAVKYKDADNVERSGAINLLGTNAFNLSKGTLGNAALRAGVLEVLNKK